MNTVSIHKTGSTLEITVSKPFNLRVREIIESRLSPEITTLKIDLTNSRIIDSEAVIFMYNWNKNRGTLELINPPAVFFEILDILELTDHWDLNYHTTEESNG